MRKLMLLAIFVWSAAGAFAAGPQDDPLNAVVKIEVTSATPNYWLPWQSQLPQSSSGSGAVIKGGMILTNAHNVADSSLTEGLVSCARFASVIRNLLTLPRFHMPVIE